MKSESSFSLKKRGKTSYYYSKFQSLVSRLANALSGQANHKIRTSESQKSRRSTNYLAQEIFTWANGLVQEILEPDNSGASMSGSG